MWETRSQLCFELGTIEMGNEWVFLTGSILQSINITFLTAKKDLKIFFIDFRGGRRGKREPHGFAVPLIYVSIGWFLTGSQTCNLGTTLQPTDLPGQGPKRLFKDWETLIYVSEVYGNRSLGSDDGHCVCQGLGSHISGIGPSVELGSRNL